MSSGLIYWAAICRNEIVLTEASNDRGDTHKVQELASKLLHKRTTPGWEYASSRIHGLRGVKFHVVEHSEVPGHPPLTWIFSAVADSSLEDVQVKNFLEKLVYITEPMRNSDPLWRQGPILAVQESFLPSLRQRMQQVPAKDLDLEGIRNIMSRNIDALLGREPSQEDTTATVIADEHHGQVGPMAHQMRDWNGQVNRFKLMQHAKHGRILGSVITSAVLFLPAP
jgi:hypothetical protein